MQTVMKKQYVSRCAKPRAALAACINERGRQQTVAVASLHSQRCFCSDCELLLSEPTWSVGSPVATNWKCFKR